MRKELISLYRVRPEQIYLVPNGISVEKITPKPPLTSVESFGFVGRLAKTKKIDVLLAGFKIFLQHQDNAKLLIYGVGPQEKLIEDFIKRNKLDEKIHLMGFEKNTPTIFSSFDVFLLTSEGEGISNSLLEAMAYGIPSIVSKVAGNVDVIHQNHSGLLFSPDSPSEMANCMLILSENLDFANKMSNNARKSLERNYNMRSIVSKLISIISESI
jgi:glycosyltransferase involved in cell wall biosynthesis